MRRNLSSIHLNSPKLKIIPRTFLIVMLALWIGACTTSREDHIGAQDFYCTASVSTFDSSSSKVTLLVTGDYGESPYQISSIDLSGSQASSISGNQEFSASTTVEPSFSTLASIEGLVGEVTLVDNDSNTASCNFTVTNNDYDSISCTIASSDDTPGINDDVILTLSASNGTGPYVFSSIDPGTNGEIRGAIAATDDDKATVIVAYSVSGSVSPEVSVVDSQGNTGTCSVDLKVGNTSGGSIDCAITATPASPGVGEPVNFDIVASNGSGDYTFETFSAGDDDIEISPLTKRGNAIATATYKYSVKGTKNARALVTDSDGEHGFCDLQLVVSQTSATQLSCSITPWDSSPDVGQSVTFSVIASGGQGNYSFTDFSPGYNGNITSPLTQSVNDNALAYGSASYSTSGTKTVRVDIEDGFHDTAYCVATIHVGGSGLNCEAVMNPSPSSPWQWVNVSAQISGGSIWTYLESIDLPDNHQGISFDPNGWGRRSARMRFQYSNEYSVRLNIRDPQNGSTASCTKVHTVE